MPIGPVVFLAIEEKTDRWTDRHTFLYYIGIDEWYGIKAGWSIDLEVASGAERAFI